MIKCPVLLKFSQVKNCAILLTKGLWKYQHFFTVF